MLSTSDEQIIIAYIFNALEESEEAEVSVRLSQDASFRRYYRRMLKSLQPILSARTIEDEEVLIRQESEGLASRTMSFLRKSLETMEMASQPGMDTSEQMMETLADTCAETKVAKNSEPALEPEYK
ncbi:MAG: hypothetical protein IJQ31_13815 [Thermoguttaceae bacterium]|nr:hypothetical protein [Thermoguttaceae bacterium]